VAAGERFAGSGQREGGKRVRQIHDSRSGAVMALAGNARRTARAVFAVNPAPRFCPVDLPIGFPRAILVRRVCRVLANLLCICKGVMPAEGRIDQRFARQVPP
jgi:hypothetical protein